MKKLLVTLLLITQILKTVKAGGCSKSFQSVELRKSRLEQLKGNILAQLGSYEAAREDAELPSVDEQRKQNETIARYDELVRQKIAPEPKCVSEEFFAKPVTTFTGTISLIEGLGHRPKRGSDYSSEVAYEPSLFEGSILRQYAINMQMVELPRNRSMLSKADLLLHQLRTDTLDQPVSDERQVVQIRAVIRDIRYFVDKKSLSVFGHGPQIFNVLRAMEVWVEEGGTGDMTLEVLITCSGSPNCSNHMPHGEDGKLTAPAAVEFEHNPADSSRLPRIVALSKNPKDASHWSRKKRSADSDTSRFCNPGQNTCCLHSFNISFVDDLGFHSIHSPKEFEANYCNGQCSSLQGLGNSERVSFLEHLRDNPSISVEPCCSGMEYKPLAILMKVYDPKTRTNSFIIDQLDQVTVTKCTCA